MLISVNEAQSVKLLLKVAYARVKVGVSTPGSALSARQGVDLRVTSQLLLDRFAGILGLPQF